eukprot:6255420-Prymnesium_polylepis.1
MGRHAMSDPHPERDPRGHCDSDGGCQADVHLRVQAVQQRGADANRRGFRKKSSGTQTNGPPVAVRTERSPTMPPMGPYIHARRSAASAFSILVVSLSPLATPGCWLSATVCVPTPLEFVSSAPEDEVVGAAAFRRAANAALRV